MSLKFVKIEEERLDRRIIKTRESLENALVELLNTKSFHEISVTEISDQARINRATFYDHFQDKEALFYGLIEKQYREYILKKLETPNPCTQADFKNLIIGTYEFLRNHRGKCTTDFHVYKSVAKSKIQEQIFSIVDLWLRPRGEDELKSTAISWAIFGAANQLSLMPEVNKKRLNFIVEYINSIV